nr:hypothetical protein [Nitrosomonas nitrosa]
MFTPRKRPQRLQIASLILTSSVLATTPTLASESDVMFHVAGYADTTLTNVDGGDSEFTYTLAPIVHMQVGESLFFEAEFELEGNDRGDTETALEYATVNWLINDNVALVAGQFLSPVGYFFQNMHPSWINKLASVPAGFGHGGAAPLSDFGLQLRGGKAFAGGQSINYALYLANGPSLGLEGMDDLDLDVEASSDNPDGERVAGGRLGWLPIPTLELGMSLASGNVRLAGGDAGHVGVKSEFEEPSRLYAVQGIDLSWQAYKNFGVRGEWLQQRVGSAAASLVPDGAKWRAWYLQGNYRFGGEHWETVLRFGDSNSPHSEATYRQTAIGLNYLFSSRSLLKLSWELNSSANEETAADRVLLQFAFGF